MKVFAVPYILEFSHEFEKQLYGIKCDCRGGSLKPILRECFHRTRLGKSVTIDLWQTCGYTECLAAQTICKPGSPVQSVEISLCLDLPSQKLRAGTLLC